MKLWHLFAICLAVTPVLVCVSPATAGSIKVWSNGETVKASDLNSNFSHVHTGVDAPIVNADISASAAIAHSKLATPGLIPKAWARVGSCSTLDGGPQPCTVSAGSLISDGGVYSTVAGIYYLTMGFTPSTDAGFGALVTPVGTMADEETVDSKVVCQAHSFTVSPPHMGVACLDLGTLNPVATGFTITVMQ